MNAVEIEYAVITDCTGADCGECAYGSCVHWCHLGQSWSPVGGWVGDTSGHCAVCGDVVPLTVSGNIATHLELTVRGFVDGTVKPQYVRGPKCKGSLRRPEATR